MGAHCDKMMRAAALTLLAFATLLRAQEFSGSMALSIDGDPIRYADPPKADPVARLMEKLASGKLTLQPDPKTGFLPAVLKALDIPVSSQTLVFSKTSFQLQRISPETPRAIYFNDDVYVGWVPGSTLLELSAADPTRGAMFYSMAATPGRQPSIERRDECLQCHASPKTLGIPGHTVRSVYPDAKGYALTNTGSFITTHKSPLAERWGGWYVTGAPDQLKHMGNSIAPDPEKPEQLRPLTAKPDLSGFLSSHSDIVALMVLEHQTAMHNVLARAGIEARIAMFSERDINKALGRPEDSISDSTRRRLDRIAEVVTRNLLFFDEAPLPTPLRNKSTFAEEFSARGPRDPKGRSLREFDLATRLFRYPCSYLIYSPAFDGLPVEVKTRVYTRLRALLAGKPEIFEILAATKPGFAVNEAP